jgi:hypothetical protein
LNIKQQAAREQLQQELLTRRQIATLLPNSGESEGGKFSFTEVEGVTVIIGEKGGYQIPSVRRYPETGKPGETALDAAVYADRHFREQEKRADLGTGHLGSIVDTEWRCNDSNCPCQKQSPILRFSRSVK